ncbi:MAG: hypothetical protein MUE53_01310 [Chitinophagales bacterium]|jgi:predicted  nucleic acid-binding Zn-ribbon protein|nr:hypothetical protein [Chitinophagales bacterium]
MKLWKNLASLIIMLISFGAFAQEFSSEFTEKSFYKLGKQTSIRVKLPNQNESRFKKVVAKYLEDKKARRNKDFTEKNMLYYQSYLDVKSSKIYDIACLFQDERGFMDFYIALFVDSQTVTDQSQLLTVGNNFYNLSYYNLYQDSIEVSEDKLKKMTKELESTNNKIEKHNKAIENASQDTKDRINENQKLSNRLSSEEAKLPGAEAKFNDAKTVFDAIKAERLPLEALANEVKDLDKQIDRLDKNLKNLKKEPELNANIIPLQEEEIKKLRNVFDQKNRSFKTTEKSFNDRFKSAEKNFDKAEKELNVLNKEIKNIKKDIQKNDKNVSKNSDKSEDFSDNIKDLSERSVSLTKEIQTEKVENMRLKADQAKYMLF